MQSDIVLDKEAVIPGVIDLCDRRILIHAAWGSEDKVGQSILRLAAVERECAVVVQQRIVNHLFKRRLDTELQRVLAPRQVHHVTKTVVITARNRAADRIRGIEIAGDGDLRQ